MVKGSASSERAARHWPTAGGSDGDGAGAARAESVELPPAPASRSCRRSLYSFRTSLAWSLETLTAYVIGADKFEANSAALKPSVVDTFEVKERESMKRCVVLSYSVPTVIA